MGQHLNTGEITAVFQGGATLAATGRVPNMHLLMLGECENSPLSEFSSGFSCEPPTT
jgi:hypothetical protein